MRINFRLILFWYGVWRSQCAWLFSNDAGWRYFTEPGWLSFIDMNPFVLRMINIKCPLRSLRNLLWRISHGCGINGKWLIYYDNHRQPTRGWNDSTLFCTSDISVWVWTDPVFPPPWRCHDSGGEIQRVDLRKTSKKMHQHIFVSKAGIWNQLNY